MIWLCTDWRIDYAAIGAIVGAASALAAAWAAWEARNAAKVALKVDANNAARIADRERRDAVPLAYAIQHELWLVGGLTKDLPEIAEKGRGVGLSSQQLLLQISELHPRFLVPILESSVRDLGCFDADVGRALGIALASSQSMHGAVNIPGVPPDDVIAKRILDDVFDAARKCAKHVLDGAVALDPLIGDAETNAKRVT